MVAAGDPSVRGYCPYSFNSLLPKTYQRPRLDRIDIHVDYEKLAGKRQVELFNLFGETLERLSPDFQREQGYEIPPPGGANMSMSTTQLAERYGCVSMTLEMPFKDNVALPDEVYGWSPQRSKYLAYACLDALRAVLPELAAATAERDSAKREKVTA